MTPTANGKRQPMRFGMERTRWKSKRMEVCAEKIPNALRQYQSWVVWRHVEKDGKPTKIPFSTDGKAAKSNDRTTWTTFDAAIASYKGGGWEGIGFVLSEHDPYCGIDLDSCYDSFSKTLDPWAKEVIDALDTYAEVSPSGTGIKLIVEAKWPLAQGKNKKLGAVENDQKAAGIECYDRARFWTVTGRRGGKQLEPQQRQMELDLLAMKHWPNEMVCERARRYLAQIEPAISGQGGSRQTCKAICAVVKGFGLDEQSALMVLRDYNATCKPAWQEKELIRKIQWVQKQSGAVGYLRDADSEKWSGIEIELPRLAEVGEVTQMCVEAMEGLDPIHRKGVLAMLRTVYT